MANYILLGFTPAMFSEIRAQAKAQKLSVTELIRRAVQYYLSGSRLALISRTSTDDMPKSASEFFWTQAEKEYADSVIQKHFDDDC